MLSAESEPRWRGPGLSLRTRSRSAVRTPRRFRFARHATASGLFPAATGRPNSPLPEDGCLARTRSKPRYSEQMSKQNVELHYQSIDAVNRRDFSAFVALMDEDVEAVSRIAAMEGGLHGHTGVRRWWEEWFAAFPDYRIEVVEVKDLGDVTVAAMSAVGHGAGSEVPFEDTTWLACRWREGRCVWWSVFYSWDEVLEAARVSEHT
jgi:ketosteroid isomerase-like protein